jgi:GNAT superfamily N-acetyltransferase
MDGPRACLPEEDIEIVNLINSLFREGTGQDTRTDYPLLYDPEMLHNRRVIRLDGKIVAHVPVLMREVVTGQDRLPVGLISATLTHPDYRHRGLATRCLMDCVRIMDENAWPVSVLWTAETTFPFYQNSGWEAVSSQGWVYKIRNDESHLFPTGPFTATPYVPEDPRHVEAVRRLHDAEPNRVERSEYQHAALFSLPMMGTLLAVDGDRVAAYLVYGHGMNKPGLIEAVGDRDAIGFLVRHVLEQGLFEYEAQVVVPFTSTALAQVMEAAKPESARPVEEAAGVGFQMHRINSLEGLLTSIKGHIHGRSGGLEGAVSLVCTDSGETVTLSFSNGNVSISTQPLPDRVSLSRRQLIQLIFGSYPGLPAIPLEGPAKMLLEQIFPYYLPIWELDHC